MMVEEKGIELECAVYREKMSFSVKIARDAKVGTLQEAIVDKKKDVNDRFRVDPASLTLYLAGKKEGTKTKWLRGGQNVDDLLRGDVDHTYQKMFPWWKLNNKDLFGPSFTPGDEEIHVLVELPEGAAGALRKRKLSEVSLVNLNDLWDYSKLDIAVLPKPTELKALLQQPLPFRLHLNDGKIAKKICDKNGGFLQCKNLTLMIESYLFDCTRPVESMASENTWQAFYDALFRILNCLCYSKGMFLSFQRSRGDSTGTTEKELRPDLILHYHGLVLLRGEERSSSTPINVSREDLTKKMLTWNPMFYGDLPYILGYATSGQTLLIVTIDRHLYAENVAEYDIFMEKEEVIKTFYNLPFFLHAMVTLSKRTCASSLMPYTPHVTNRRTIELMDVFVKRTIKHQQCIDEGDFERLIVIYTTLQGLNSRGHGKTHLQTVRRLKLPHKHSKRLTVQLQPLGYSRRPVNVEEVHEWLQGMLTALKFWHSCNYCHGDLRWRNIVYVPTSDQGYWVLIDMDESHRPNTTTITWEHQRNGEILTFQHDLYQLGRLMELVTVPLTDELLSVQTALLSAMNTQLCAEEVLTIVNQVESKATTRPN